MGTPQIARLADSDADFERFNVVRNRPVPREDTLRTNGSKGSFEWWYTDAAFEDGTTVVVIFFAKNYFDVSGPAWPTVDFEVTNKNGERVNVFVQGEKGRVVSSAKNVCDVRIEDCFIRWQEDGSYHVRYKDASITYDAIMRPKVPMWRPGSGYWLYGEGKREKQFGWFVALPEAIVDATLSMDGAMRTLSGGHGYHDHNWGNVSLDYIFNHWYWGRAKVGEYNVIISDMILHKRYGNKRLMSFMCAQGDAIVSDDSHITKAERSGTRIHPKTGKFIDDSIKIIQHVSDDEEYVISFDRKYDIMHRSLLEVVSPLKRKLAQMVGINPTYLRIGGDVTLTVKKDGKVETHTQEGLWEQYFTGSNKYPTIEGVTYKVDE